VDVGLRFHLSVNPRPDNVLQAKKRLQKANARASQTVEETVAGKVQDNLCKSRKRALETPEQVLHL